MKRGLGKMINQLIGEILVKKGYKKSVSFYYNKVSANMMLKVGAKLLK